MKYLRIRLFMQQHGITQENIAAVLGKSQPAISMKMTGEREWSKQEIDVVLDFFRTFDPDASYENLWEAA